MAEVVGEGIGEEVCHDGVADEYLAPVGVVAGVYQPSVVMLVDALGHGTPGGGVVDATQDDGRCVGGDCRIGPVGEPGERVGGVGDGPLVVGGEPLGKGFALETTHVRGQEVLPEQVVGFDPVMVDQGDGRWPADHQPAQGVGQESSGAAAAYYDDPGMVGVGCGLYSGTSNGVNSWVQA